MEIMIKTEGKIADESLLGEYREYVNMCVNWKREDDAKRQNDAQHQDVGPSMQQTETSFENMSRQEQMRCLFEDVLSRGRVTPGIRYGKGTQIEQYMYQRKVSTHDWEEFKQGDYYNRLSENEKGILQDRIFYKGSGFRIEKRR